MKKLSSIILITFICLCMVSCGNKKQQESTEKQSTAAKSVSEINAAAVYNDVDSDDWYCDSISWAVNNSISEAAKPTSFGVNDTVNKKEIILYLWKAEGSPGAVATAKAMPDSDPDSDINKAIDWALDRGIIKEISECISNDPATRLDAIELIWTEAGNPEYGDVQEFDDAVGIDSVNWARFNEITNGTGNNLFSPDMDCSKAHILTFLFRAK